MHHGTTDTDGRPGRRGGFPGRRAWQWALLTLVVLLGAWHHLGRWYREELLLERRARLTADLAPYGNALTKNINRRFAILDGLATFTHRHLDSGGEIVDENFRLFAEALSSTTEGVRGLSIAPDAVQQFVYPLPGNQNIVGGDLLEPGPRAGVVEDVRRAVRLKRVTVTGTYLTRDGETRVVTARKPVFREGAFWGLVTMVLEADPLLTEAGISPELEGMTLAVKDSDGEVFYGDPAVLEADPVAFNADLPEGSWALLAAPAQGWDAAIRRDYLIAHGSGLMIALLLPVLVFLVVNRQQRLEDGIARRTQALRESEQRFRLLYEEAPVAYQSLDADGHILEVNSAWLEELGYERDDVIGLWFGDLLAGEGAARFPAHFRRLKADGRFRGVEFRMKRKSGEIITVSFEGRVGHDQDGAFMQTHCVFINLTERRRAEQVRDHLVDRVRQQARRTRQILATVPEGVLLLDVEGRVRRANPAAEEVLDVLAGAEVGDVVTQLGDRSLDALLTSPPTVGLWHEVRAEGRIFEVIARPMEDAARPEGWVLVAREVTRERAIEERTRQHERLAAVGQLAAGVAHDFNNVMATIVLYADLVARTQDLTGRAREQVATIVDQARHATNLIQQILDFSRRSVLKKQPLDLEPLLKETVKMLARTLPETIRIDLVCDGGEHTIHADPTRIRQAVMNLAINARDAMPEGGVLRIDLARVVFEPDGALPLPEMEPGAWIRLTVSDTGEGMPAEVLPHIFEPFFTTKERGQGTGLGLPQVYGIVRQHAGQIDVESRSGEGSTFTLYLPALAERAPDPLAAGSVPSALRRGAGEAVLVVEDDAKMREALVTVLSGLNYRILEAANGEEALAVFARTPVSLVLSDAVMPKMGGMALLHALRERGDETPVILLTGHSLEERLNGLRDRGLAEWLPKPPDLTALAAAIDQALREER